MSVTGSRSDTSEIVKAGSPIDGRRLELLIKEAKRLQRRRWSVIGVVVAAAVAIVVTAVQVSNSHPTKTGPATPVVNFIDSMNRANGTRFVATYRLNGYLFLQNGTIVITQIPSPPGTKVTTNADGYSGTGRLAYLFHGPSGRIIQWIKSGTNVNACVNVPKTGNFATGTFGRLQCSRPSPYIPSNAFAEADVGFVPTYVLQSVEGLVGVRLQKKAVVTSMDSREFGTLRCLTQFQNPTTQTTCINRAGYVVSWVLDNGSGYSSSRVTLTTLSRGPTAKDFKTLLRPTKALILPTVG